MAKYILENEHTHFGIYLWLFVITVALIVFFTNISLINPPQEDTPQQDYEITEQIIHFDFPGEIIIYSAYGDVMSETDDLSIPRGFIENFFLKINSTNDIVCIEHKFDDVMIEDEYQIDAPFDLAVHYKENQVDCFELSNKQGYHSLLVYQEPKIEYRQTTVYITLWGEY